jgi:hypothetical protein
MINMLLLRNYMLHESIVSLTSPLKTENCRAIKQHGLASEDNSKQRSTVITLEGWTSVLDLGEYSE